ncbi:ABC transporter ATP-binding protein [Sporosarcina sp. E16_3]|uniref:ABC transporter ATP-binding protein n=1 Tax=Sporosarcina sp. E16_3 TaxID=2789293 RepID=UPI001A919B6C|nr:ABC transporter ATP-binding protein [Sporosarcina sp. E16_3]MBO0602523.1 ABC transporter ATP-binding protein [Sporosarcina sp. E16_3]
MKYLLHFTKKIHDYSGKILYINLICMMLIGLLESVGIFLLIPLIGLTGILDVSTEGISFFSWMTDLFLGIPETISLVIILGVYVLLMVGQSIFKRNQTILGAKIQQGFIRQLKEETYRSLLQANWGFFLKKRKSDIINIMTNEMSNVSAGIYLFLQFISSLIITIIQIAIAFYLSVKLTSFILLCGLLLILFSKKFIRRSRSFGKETVQLTETYLAGITDHFNGIKDIKSNSLEESHLNWFFSLTKRIEQNRINLTTLSATSQMIYKMVSTILLATFVFIAIKMLTAQPAQLMLIMVIFARLWPRIAGIQSNLEQLGATIPSLKILLNLQKESLEARELHNQDYINDKPMEIYHGLDCLNVHFKYGQNEDTYALKKIDVHIPANRMTAIVGPSGAGKSTLIDLLMGLNQADQGLVTIDHEPLTTDNLVSLRKSISYIPQDPFLFNATIRENLLIIDPTASHETIWEALEFAAAAEFVRKLPQGLDTRIGDRGIRLSGGERQRLVLARAILRKPSILVLDEATSALDVENEVKIQGAIERLKGTMTIIVIAHRLSTIRNADQVLVMDAGEIIQAGEYNQLAQEKEGMFGNLLAVQMQTTI